MSRKNFIGALLCVAVFAGAFLAGDGTAHYFNLLGLLIVLSGTLGATLLSYPFDDLGAAFRVARNTYTVKVPTTKEIVNLLLNLSHKSKQEGILALQLDEKRTEVTFLKDALGMLVDGFGRKELAEILTTEMQFFRRRRDRHERVFRHMARLAPAFGVAGSVVGLIGMLTGIGDTAVILRTIPLALTSTLYGIVLCNFVFNPIAESIHFKTQRELLMQRLVTDGVFAILDERNPHRLERKLKSFLTPASRQGEELTFQEIRRRYRELRLEQERA